MKKKVTVTLIAIIVLTTVFQISNVFAATTTGTKGIFSLYIPDGYEKILDDYRDYFEMETYELEGSNTFFRVVVYNKTFFDLNLSGNMWFSYLLTIPKDSLYGFTYGDLEKEAKHVEENDGYTVTNKELLTVNGYPARRITAVAPSGYTTDERQVI